MTYSMRCLNYPACLRAADDCGSGYCDDCELELFCEICGEEVCDCDEAYDWEKDDWPEDEEE